MNSSLFYCYDMHSPDMVFLESYWHLIGSESAALWFLHYYHADLKAFPWNSHKLFRLRQLEHLSKGPYEKINKARVKWVSVSLRTIVRQSCTEPFLSLNFNKSMSLVSKHIQAIWLNICFFFQPNLSEFPTWQWGQVPSCHNSGEWLRLWTSNMFQVEQEASSVWLEVDPGAASVSPGRAADTAIEEEAWNYVVKLVFYLGKVTGYFSNLVCIVILFACSYTTERIFCLS